MPFQKDLRRDPLQLGVKCGGRVYRRDGAAVMVCKVARAAYESCDRGAGLPLAGV